MVNLIVHLAKAINLCSANVRFFTTFKNIRKPRRFLLHLSLSMPREFLHYSAYVISTIATFYPSATSAEGVLSSPPSVRPSIRVSVCRDLLVCTITRRVFELRSPNLHQICILGPFRSLPKMVLIDLELQSHLGSKRSKSAKNELVRTRTRRVSELGSLNLYQMCIFGPLRILLK